MSEMKRDGTLERPEEAPRHARRMGQALVGGFVVGALVLGGAAGAAAQATLPPVEDDPRVGLGAGWFDAEEASWNMTHLAHLERPEGFYNPDDPGAMDLANSDIGFRGDFAFVGNFHGFNIYDISDPANPEHRTSVECPGGQGDVSVFGDLVFMSVQEPRSRIDCGTEGTSDDPVDPERFRGVRIFDVSDIDAPEQIAAVQTCRGSHTHTLVTDPDDAGTLYVYNSGTSFVRPQEELERCDPDQDPDNPDTAYWSIDVIEVPLDAPEDAELLDSPRVFMDEETGRIDGLWDGGDHGEGTQATRQTDQCHDITAYPEIGLAAGACSGNGILLDISDPANPERIASVSDPNFAYWHSATFSNDGSTVIFTDEWGGGTSPRCQVDDDPLWGSNSLFEIVNGEFEHRGYYKIPAPQEATENCVAHNGSLVPVPGRDIKVQAWYQGGVSIFDFTDPSEAFEIAYFDRGPIDAEELYLGGYWATYWYNGNVFGSEIARGFDTFQLEPNEHLTENELEAARLVQYEEFNPQHQPRNVWPAEFPVAWAYYDQLVRHEGLPGDRLTEVEAEIERVQQMDAGAERRAELSELATVLWTDARAVDQGEVTGDAERIRRLAGALLEIAGEETPGDG